MSSPKAKHIIWPKITNRNGEITTEHEDGLTFILRDGVLSFYRKYEPTEAKGEA